MTTTRRREEYRRSLGLPSGADGFGLAFILMVIGILSALATGLAVTIRLDTAQEAAEEQSRRNFYAAEAEVNVGVARTHDTFLNFNIPAASDSQRKTLDLRGQTVSHQRPRDSPRPGHDAPRPHSFDPGWVTGGLENYPRFHEKWTGRTLRYRGSFVSLGQPLHMNGPWCGTGGTKTSGCNIYEPPNRDWDYDAWFDNAANLPPLSPRVVWVQQTLFSQEFR